MMVVLAAIILMLLIKAFVVQVYRIPSASMEDTLLTGDRVLVNKLVYHFRGIARGDIVVFSGQGSWGTTTGAPDPAPPGNPLLRAVYDVLADIGVYSTQTYYIKRVIGLPGDHVVCCVNGKVTVNGVPLDETSYLFPGASPSIQTFNVIVPPGRLWVMGDNRAISDDSRGHMSRLPCHGDRSRERGGRPGVPGHLAAVADRRPADSRHVPAGRAARRGRRSPGAPGGRAAAARPAALPAAVPAAGVVALAGFPVLALRMRRVRGGRRVRAGAAGGVRRCPRRLTGRLGGEVECEYQAVEGQFEIWAGIVDDVGLPYA